MIRRPIATLLVVATGVLGLAGLVNRLLPPQGLNAVYYPNRTWSTPPAVSTVDPQASTARLLRAWHGAPPESFSASWTGSILVWREGRYTFSTLSDDGSWVYVDGQLVVDNGGRHGPSPARGSTTLTRGVHAIFIQYVQEGGGLQLDVLWGRGEDRLAVMPGWALAPRRPAFWRFMLSAALRLVLIGAEWLWTAALLLGVLVALARGTVRAKAWCQRTHVWPALGWIVAGSLALNLVGIWWGLPGSDSWAPDELTPTTVIVAAAQGFSHGWFDRYPPFHFYLLTAAFSPLFLLDWWGRVDLNGEPVSMLLALIGRGVSIAAGVGTVVAIYSSGARVFGRRAGLAAALMFALVTPFVYYAKTANLDVPYVFWFSLSLLFYLRALERLALVDLVGCAVCATLAIVTKDQAYGLYLLVPLAFVHRIWRVNRDAGVHHPLARAVLDRRLAVAGLVALLLFVCLHNLLFNWSGFVQHVRYITGGGSGSYRDFEPTTAGRVSLLLLTVDLVRVAWGWPLFLISIAGVVLAGFTERYRQAAWWLVIPPASYYLGFINVVLYNYDRFVLPICVVLSIFGGLAVDRWLVSGSRRRAYRLAAVGAVGVYTVVYAATVDVTMLRDSRYRVEEWLAARVGPGEIVGFVFPMQYYPRLERFNGGEMTSVAQLREYQPAYFVLNADYARAERHDSPIGQLIGGLQGGSLGYDLALRFREPSPWPWLPQAHRDLVGPRTETLITSSLRHINPTFEVFARRR